MQIGVEFEGVLLVPLPIEVHPTVARHARALEVHVAVEPFRQAVEVEVQRCFQVPAPTGHVHVEKRRAALQLLDLRAVVRLVGGQRDDDRLLPDEFPAATHGGQVAAFNAAPPDHALGALAAGERQGEVAGGDAGLFVDVQRPRQHGGQTRQVEAAFEFERLSGIRRQRAQRVRIAGGLFV